MGPGREMWSCLRLQPGPPQVAVYVQRSCAGAPRRERLNIFADMAIDSCTGAVYLSDGGRFYPVGNVAKLSFVGAQPGGMLWLCRRYSPS